MSPQELEEVMFLYCAGALEPEEASEIEALLDAGDPAARDARAHAEALLGQLPLALDAQDPPPDVEEQLMARASRSLDATEPAVLRPARANLRWIAPLAAAAALLLMVGVAALWTRGETAREAQLALESSLAEERSRVEGLRRELEAARRERRAPQPNPLPTAPEVAQVEPAPQPAEQSPASPEGDERVRELLGRIEGLEDQLAKQSETLAAQSSQIQDQASEFQGQREAVDAELAAAQHVLAILRAPDVGVVDLLSPESTSPSSGSVFWDPALRHCYLHARGLEALAEGERYALWLEYEGERVHRIADFLPDAKGAAELFEKLPIEEGEVSRTFVTIQSAPNAKRPSDRVVLSEWSGGTSGEPGVKTPRGRYRRRG